MFTVRFKVEQDASTRSCGDRSGAPVAVQGHESIVMIVAVELHVHNLAFFCQCT
jgi:hypothetical protein